MSDTFDQVAADDEAQYLTGRESLESNVAAARAVTDAVASTLGPMGLDKMLVSSHGDVTVTNDGETVLREMDVDHPAAKTLVEVAKTQAADVGDGTTTAVLLAGELLRRAADLVEQGTHPTLVVDGYQHAVEWVAEDVAELAESVDVDDELLRRVVASSLTGKTVTPHAETLTELVLEAARAVTVEDTVDLEYLYLRAHPGETADRSELVRGAVMDAEPCRASMPTELADATVLLVHDGIRVPEPESEVNPTVTTAERRQQFLRRDEDWARAVAEHVAAVGADAVFCNNFVSDRLEQHLASRGILAVEHVERTNVPFAFLREVTGATPVTEVREATTDHLGRADVSRNAVGFAVENPETHGATLLLRGTTPQTAAEVERNARDALDVVSQTVASGRVLPGGGATEMELAMRLRDHATAVEGRLQLAVEAFADALEAVPRTLAKNAGLDAVDSLVDLRAAHAAGETAAGLDVVERGVADMFEAGVVQPAHVTEQSLYHGARVAAVILKIDGTISAADLSGDADGDGDGTGALPDA